MDLDLDSECMQKVKLRYFKSVKKRNMCSWYVTKLNLINILILALAFIKYSQFSFLAFYNSPALFFPPMACRLNRRCSQRVLINILGKLNKIK